MRQLVLLISGPISTARRNCFIKKGSRYRFATKNLFGLFMEKSTSFSEKLTQTTRGKISLFRRWDLH